MIRQEAANSRLYFFHILIFRQEDSNFSKLPVFLLDNHERFFEIRLQQSLNLFYLNLDASAANHIVFSAFDANTEFLHLIIYIGFYFHYIVRYQGFGTDQRGIDEETAFFGLTDFHAIERLIPFASLIAIDSSQGDMR